MASIEDDEQDAVSSHPSQLGSEEEEQEQVEELEQPVDEGEDSDAEEQQPSQSDDDDSDPVVGPGRPRGRGRGRGRPRGSGLGSRPRGRGRGRGRGRKSGVIVLRNPMFTGGGASTGAEDDEEGEKSMEVDEEGAVQAETRWFRDVDGVKYETDGEELFLPEDPAGEAKVDRLGNLLGGRKFKGSTFTSAIRANPHKKYILSIEAARATGYRDSLYYFRRNPLLVKITLTQSEKEILIADKILSQNLRSRIVTMVTARSAFIAGGSKLIKDGRWVDDDYYEDKAREECIAKGFKPGDLVGDVGDNSFTDPNREAKLAAAAAAAAQQLSTSTDRASAVYKTGGPTTFFGGAGLSPFAGEMPSSKKAALSRDDVTEVNWMSMMANAVVEANEQFAKMRKERMDPTGGASSGAAPAPAAAPATVEVTPASAVPPNLRAQSTLTGSRGGTPAQGRQPSPNVAASAPSPAPPPPEPEQPISTEGLSQSALRALKLDAKRKAGPKKAKKAQVPLDDRPKGVYEPHTGLMHYRVDTQPTYARVERVTGPDADAKNVLGGTFTGSGAWGVAWVDTYAEYRDYEREKEEEMRRLYDSLMSQR